MEGETDHSGIVIDVLLNGQYDNKVATTITSADGYYQINNLHVTSDDKYNLLACKEGFAADNVWLRTILNPIETVPDMVLRSPKWITFNWVYQPDGTTDFTSDGLRSGTGTLYSGLCSRISQQNIGFLFSIGKSTNDPASDIYFGDWRESNYSLCANNGNGGVHDMGEVSLESVSEAPAASNGVGIHEFYDNQATDAIISHTYCIITMDGNHYAKIHITGMGEGEDPDPFILATPTQILYVTPTHTPMPYNRIMAEVHSPVELRIYDSVGRVTGTFNGEGQAAIPDSFLSGSMVIIYSPYDEYRYELIGTGEGSYVLTITRVIDGESVIFSTGGVTTSGNELHEYTVDWDSIKQGDKGCTMLIDYYSDGTFDETIHLASSDRGGTPLWVWITTATIAILSTIMVSISWYYFYRWPKAKAVTINQG